MWRLRKEEVRSRSFADMLMMLTLPTVFKHPIVMQSGEEAAFKGSIWLQSIFTDVPSQETSAAEDGL